MVLSAFNFLFLSIQGINYTKFVMMTKFVGLASSLILGWF